MDLLCRGPSLNKEIIIAKGFLESANFAEANETEKSYTPKNSVLLTFG